MRSTIPLLVICTWAAATIAQAQTAAPAPALATQQPASLPATNRSQPQRRKGTRARSRSATAVAKKQAPVDRTSGVLALGASDITGNKELPKVMVIVPWKSPTDAGGVVPPSDSVMNEVLGPVDRGVFQRRIRYYGQLNAASERRPAQPVAPVGDTH